MLFRVQAGCIAEVWEYFDTAHLFSTLEAPE
jgi:ketosteroid isomerase-like protein